MPIEKNSELNYLLLGIDINLKNIFRLIEIGKNKTEKIKNLRKARRDLLFIKLKENGGKDMLQSFIEVGFTKDEFSDTATDYVTAETKDQTPSNFMLLKNKFPDLTSFDRQGFKNKINK